jgi:hypothetical protein
MLYLFVFYSTMGNEKIGIAGNNQIYTDDVSYKDDILSLMDTCLGKLNESGIATKTGAKIIFCTTPEKFNRNTLYLNKGALGTNNALLNIINLAPANYKDNIQERDGTNLRNRKLSDIITHELVHSYLKEKLGIWKYLQLSVAEKWKNEGFCEYIANSSSFDTEEGLRIFIENDEQRLIEAENDLQKTTYFYFKSRLKTDYLLNFKKITVEEFLMSEFDEEELENEIRIALRTEKYKFQAHVHRNCNVG